jgi:hypothetical protein
MATLGSRQGLETATNGLNPVAAASLPVAVPLPTPLPAWPGETLRGSGSGNSSPQPENPRKTPPRPSRSRYRYHPQPKSTTPPARHATPQPQSNTPRHLDVLEPCQPTHRTKTHSEVPRYLRYSILKPSTDWFAGGLVKYAALLYSLAVTDDAPDLNWWTISDAADFCGITDQTWRTYVARGQAPAPDVRIGGKPLWRPATVRAWQASRRGAGRWGRRGDPP